jgi:hypothetical protein
VYHNPGKDNVCRLDGPCGLRSLLDVLTVYAKDFVHIGEIIRDLEFETRMAARSSYKYPKPKLDKLRDDISHIQAICVRIELSTTAKVLERAIPGLVDGVSWADVRSFYECFQVTFAAELDSQLFLFMPSDQARFYSEEETGIDVAESFKLLDGFANARTDLRKAGSCFACGMFTASVYHQMRIAELGLVSVAVSLNVPEDQRMGWDVLLRQCYSKMKEFEAAKIKPPNWKDRREVYSALLSLFELVKNGWRNPVSHIPRVYDKSKAKRMFSHIHSLMETLKSANLAQVEMPDSIELPKP